MKNMAEELELARNAIKLMIGRRANKPWPLVPDSDVDAGLAEIKQLMEFQKGKTMEPTQTKLIAAMDLLKRAAERMSDDHAPDGTWWRDYFVLTGDHMILTDEGWESGDGKEELLAEHPDAILDEVNG